ncbi:MAG: hypothetical protein J5494_02450, partial [Candidatus Methanomethylophilaceae archaeon]|nr:hypothetical protein [Candidatus Methanomethylophilaceae archaeon]
MSENIIGGVGSKRLLNECPTVIGMMTSSLESGGSLDAAVRMIATEGPGISRRLFSGVVRRTDTKSFRNMKDCLADAVRRLPDSSAGYRRAIHMCIAASESSNPEERTRMLKDASDISLEAVKDMGEAYGASLNTPCMAVFGIGILVPMILMSILPMMSVGGMLGTGSFDESIVIFVTLAVIPAAILILSVWMRLTNPFLRSGFGNSGIRSAVPLLVSVPLAIVYLSLGEKPESLLLFSLAPACVLALAMMYGDIGNERKRAECEQGLRDAVFDLGNRMLSGENFEKASCDAISAKKECAEASDSYSRELSLCRGNTVRAIVRSIKPISEDVSIALANICRCSERDITDSGRLSIALGRQFQNQNHMRKNLETSLKSMTDMMLATSMLFAPLVLGMSVSMLEPISEIAEFQSLGNTSFILSVYLAELSATIAVLMGSLGNGEDFRMMLRRFCIICPIGQIIFCISCGISLRASLFAVDPDPDIPDYLRHFADFRIGDPLYYIRTEAGVVDHAEGIVLSGLLQ